MPRKDKMLIVRVNTGQPEGQQKFVFNACRRSVETEDGFFIVPICRCIGNCDGFGECEYHADYKSPSLNKGNREVIYCFMPLKQRDE